MDKFNPKLHLPILIFGIAAPFVVPGLTIQVAVLWVMVLFALTWDMMGGQMGYNSLGNILFFGSGMYISAIVQVSMFADVGEYTAASAAGTGEFPYTISQYFWGLGLGILAAALGSLTSMGKRLNWGSIKKKSIYSVEPAPKATQ